MSPRAKIILITLIVGLLSATATVCFLYLFIFEAVGFTFGSGLFDIPLIDGPLILLGYYGAWLSPLLCPIAAFYFRGTVLRATTDLWLRILFFAMISLASLPFLGLGYAGVRLYETWDWQRAHDESAKKQELIETIKSAGITIVAADAIVVESEGDTSFAQVTLEIANLPTVVPEYRLGLQGGRNQDGLVFGFEKYSNGPNYSGSIVARFEDDRWNFYSYPRNVRISDDGKTVSFQLRIEGLRPSTLQIATTITPTLSIWLSEDPKKTPYSNYLVWRKPIPLTIKRAGN